MKKILLSEFVAGMVIGVILTTTGVFAQYKLQSSNEENRMELEEAKLVVKRVNGRFYRARNIILSSGNRVFNDRWDDYIVYGVYPWDIDLYLIRHFLEKNYTSLDDDFDEINQIFTDLHGTLIRLKNTQGAKNEDQLKVKELEARNEFDKLKAKIVPFLDSVMDL